MGAVGVRVRELGTGGHHSPDTVAARLGCVETEVRNVKDYIEKDVKTGISDVALRLEKRYDKTEQIVERRFLQMLVMIVSCIVSFISAFGYLIIKVV